MMKKYNISVNGITYAVEVEEAGGSPSMVVAAPAAAPTAAPAAAPKAAAPVAAAAPAPSAGEVQIKAPMPGTIWEVVATPGQAVKAGAVLVILEAMKMENEIMAPHDGIVDQILVAKGAAVNTGDLLVVMK